MVYGQRERRLHFHRISPTATSVINIINTNLENFCQPGSTIVKNGKIENTQKSFNWGRGGGQIVNFWEKTPQVHLVIIRE